MTIAQMLELDPYLENLKANDIDTYHEYLNSLVDGMDSARVLIYYESTPQAILVAVAKKHPVMRTEILQHRNCPQELVDWAMKEGTEESIRALISSPLSISGDDLATIWAKSEIGQRVALASRHDCPTDVLMDTWHSDFSGDSLFENNRDIAISNIAGNPNIPKKLIVEIMKYPLDSVLHDRLTLGELLFQNPAVSEETKALLAQRGVEKKLIKNEVDVQRVISSWPSNHVYVARKVQQKYRDLFSSMAHPESILDIRENLAEIKYSSKTVLQYWVTDRNNRIYKCLWPDLADNPQVNFFYSASSWEGDHAYVGIVGDLDLTDDDFKNKVHGTENWITSSNTLSFEEVTEEISRRGFQDILESEPTEEIIISAALTERANDGLFTITQKGEQYILDAGNDWFDDDMTYFAEANPDPSQKVWSKLDTNRQQTILNVIQSALQDKDEEHYKFAEYLGALLALNPSLSKEMRERLESSPSEIIKKALHV
jgi:hypothetical protein